MSSIYGQKSPKGVFISLNLIKIHFINHRDLYVHIESTFNSIEHVKLFNYKIIITHSTTMKNFLFSTEFQENYKFIVVLIGGSTQTKLQQLIT